MSALLSFQGVALRRGGRLLFEATDLALGPGEALHVAGPNGSGKSSLIRLAAGLLRAEAGTVARSPLALAAVITVAVVLMVPSGASATTTQALCVPRPPISSGCAIWRPHSPSVSAEPSMTMPLPNTSWAWCTVSPSA